MSSDSFKHRARHTGPVQRCSQCGVQPQQVGRVDRRCRSCGQIFDETQKAARAHAEQVEKNKAQSDAPPPTEPNPR